MRCSVLGLVFFVIGATGWAAGVLVGTSERESERSASTRTWENLYEVPVLDPTGEPTGETEEIRRTYMEVSTGLNYDARPLRLHAASGEPDWQPTVTAWADTGDASRPWAIETGPLRVSLSDNPNRSDHVWVNADVESLQMGVAGLVFHDTETGQTEIIETPLRVIPEVSGNTVRYPGAFTCADIEYVYERHAFKQNLIITDLAGLPDPATLGMNPSSTLVGLATRVNTSQYGHTLSQRFSIVNERGRQVQELVPVEETLGEASIVDAADSRLAFYDSRGQEIVRFAHGDAWGGGGLAADGIEVRQLYVRDGISDLLIDAVPYSWVEEADLPATIDFALELVVGTQQEAHRSFVGGETYLVTGLYQVVDGQTLIIEPGAVVKHDDVGRILIDEGGKIIAHGLELDPIIFTSSGNDDAGEVISGGDDAANYGVFFAASGGDDTTDESVIQWCRFSRFQVAVQVQETLDLENPIKHCVFSVAVAGINFADSTESRALDIVNCLFRRDPEAEPTVYSESTGLRMEISSSTGSVTTSLTNCTIDGFETAGVLLRSNSSNHSGGTLNLTMKSTIISNCDKALCDNHPGLTDSNLDISHNAYYANNDSSDFTGEFSGEQSNTSQMLSGDSPYVDNDAGDFYTGQLEQDDSITGEYFATNLEDVGAPGTMDTDLINMTIVAPQILEETVSEGSIVEGWKDAKNIIINDTNGDPGGDDEPDIGYHYPRVDYVVPTGDQKCEFRAAFSGATRVAWAPNARIDVTPDATASGRDDAPMLSVMGDSINPVEFFSTDASGDSASDPQRGDYHGVKLNQDSDPNSRFTYLRMRHANEGIQIVRPRLINPIANCQFIECTNGVRLSQLALGELGGVDVQNSLFRDCASAVLGSFQDDDIALAVQGSTFFGCGSGVSMTLALPTGDDPDISLLLEDNLFICNDRAIRYFALAAAAACNLVAVDRNNSWYLNATDLDITDVAGSFGDAVDPTDSSRNHKRLTSPRIASFTSAVREGVTSMNPVVRSGDFQYRRWQRPAFLDAFFSDSFISGDGFFLAHNEGDASRLPFLVPDGHDMKSSGGIVLPNGAVSVSDGELRFYAGVAELSSIPGPFTLSDVGGASNRFGSLTGTTYSNNGTQSGSTFGGRGRLWVAVTLSREEGGTTKNMEEAPSGGDPIDLSLVPIQLNFNEGTDSSSVATNRVLIYLPDDLMLDPPDDYSAVWAGWVALDGSLYHGNANNPLLVTDLTQGFNRDADHAMGYDPGGLAQSLYDAVYEVTTDSDPFDSVDEKQLAAQSPLIDAGTRDFWCEAMSKTDYVGSFSGSELLGFSLLGKDNPADEDLDTGTSRTEDLLDIGYHYTGNPDPDFAPFAPFYHQQKVFDAAPIVIVDIAGGTPDPTVKLVEFDISDARTLDIASGTLSDGTQTAVAVAPTRPFARTWDDDTEQTPLATSVAFFAARLTDEGSEAVYISDYRGGSTVDVSRGSFTMNTDNSIHAVAAAQVPDIGQSSSNAGTAYAACVVRRDRTFTTQSGNPSGSFDEIEVFRLDLEETGQDIEHHLVGYLHHDTGDVADDIHISDVALAANNDDLYVFWTQRDAGSSGDGELYGGLIEDAFQIDNATQFSGVPSEPGYDTVGSDAIDLQGSSVRDVIDVEVPFVTDAPSLDADWDFDGTSGGPRVVFLDLSPSNSLIQAHAARVQLNGFQVPTALYTNTKDHLIGDFDPSGLGTVNTHTLSIAVDQTATDSTPRAITTHTWGFASGTPNRDVFRNVLDEDSISGTTEDWSDAQGLGHLSAYPNHDGTEPYNPRVFHGSTSHRFDGKARSIWSMETAEVHTTLPPDEDPQDPRVAPEDTLAILATELEIVQTDVQNSDVTALYPSITIGSHTPDQFITWSVEGASGHEFIGLLHLNP